MHMERIERGSYYLLLSILPPTLPLCLPNPLHPPLNSTLPHRRPRDSITLQHRPINTNRNSLIRCLVQVLRFDTSRLSSALARDLEIDAVGVVLGAVGLVCTVQSDDFVAEDVGASDDGRGDGDGPGVVVCDEGVGGPSARRAGTADEARLSDLEEAERSRCVRSTVAADLRKVVNDGAVVAVGPGVPRQLESVASLDGNRVRCRLR